MVKFLATASLVEVHPQHLAACQRHFIERKHLSPLFTWGDCSQPVGLPWEDALFVLEAALGAAPALDGETGRRKVVAHGRTVAKRNLCCRPQSWQRYPGGCTNWVDDEYTNKTAICPRSGTRGQPLSESEGFLDSGD